MRQRIRRGTRRPVRGKAGTAHGRLADRHVDDLAPCRLGHHRSHRPGEQEVPGDIGREQITESVGFHVPERLRVRHEPGIDRSHPDAGVVHQHIDSTERVDAAATPSSTDCSSRTSIATPTARPGPELASCAAAAAVRAASRPVKTTCAPPASNAALIACPSPLVPPETTTRTSVTSLMHRPYGFACALSQGSGDGANEVGPRLDPTVPDRTRGSRGPCLRSRRSARPESARRCGDRRSDRSACRDRRA